MKTSELQGAALDWAVAKCEGWQTARMVRGKGFTPDATDKAKHYTRADVKPGELGGGGLRTAYSPSTNWAQGGPIIEREKLHLAPSTQGHWMAYQVEDFDMKGVCIGDTPLVAAMRCYVARKLGDKVTIPEVAK